MIRCVPVRSATDPMTGARSWPAKNAASTVATATGPRDVTVSGMSSGTMPLTSRPASAYALNHGSILPRIPTRVGCAAPGE